VHTIQQLHEGDAFPATALGGAANGSSRAHLSATARCKAVGATADDEAIIVESCPVCMDGDCTVTLKPCGHKLCEECAARVRPCPFCGSNVGSVLPLVTERNRSACTRGSMRQKPKQLSLVLAP